MATALQPKRIERTIRVIDDSVDWIVVDKPPHLQVHPSKPDGVFTLWDGVRELLAFEIANGGQVSIINRLDRETSGVTLICKHRDAARAFSRRMQRRQIDKEYLAIVWGSQAEDCFTVDRPLLRQGLVRPSAIHLKQAIDQGGAAALTEFKVERRFRRRTSSGEYFGLVRAVPRTGRMHQIRVHLASIGHPVVGDKIYGPSEEHYLEFIETGWTPRLAERLLLDRHALHSTRLRVPELGIEWVSDLPDDLARWIA